MNQPALIVIDMINSYDHEDAGHLAPPARRVVPGVRTLIGRARDAGAEVIYVNDNRGRWRSQVDDIVETALQGPYPELVEAVRPDAESLFVVKARHSIFYQTP